MLANGLYVALQTSIRTINIEMSVAKYGIA
jgi:hypothetical protein